MASTVLGRELMTQDFDRLPLPQALLKANELGLWKTPEDKSVWEALFPKREIVQPMLYPIESLNAESPWIRQHPIYWGEPHDQIYPGDIDPLRTVLIGDLGPERLIALDYRESMTSPSVIGLTSDRHNCWRHVSDDIESFMQAIGIVVDV